jgi:signal transduction histidine kinase
MGLADQDHPGLRVERALLHESLEELYEGAPCGYLSTLPDGTIIRANRRFLGWMGQRCEATVGRRFQDLLTVAGRIYHETHFAPLLQMQGYVNEVAFDLVTQAGRLPVIVNALQRKGEDGRPLFNRITIFNATDRRKYEQELLVARRAAEKAAAELQELNATLESRVQEEIAERLKAEEALRQAQKLESIGQLTGGVAHDFNNLLTIILGGLDMIERQLDAMPDTPETARLRRARGISADGAQRAATLTKRLLAFSRRQPLEPKVLQPNKLVAEMSELLRRTLGETIELETVLAGGLWRTVADPSQLENAILNLAVNARDAMPEGGKLTIETHNSALDEAYVAQVVEDLPAGQYVLIAVSDSGTGMDAATLEKVFEPFFTTKETGKGTGLGLSQVYGFVRQSGGHVRIYSELGEGTTIKIYLPRASGEEAEDARPSSAASDVRGGGEAVLVVEDYHDLRAYSSSVLRELGYRVVEAADGREALRLLEAHPDIELLFTDVVMPGGMNGRQLSDEAQRRRPKLKVLFTTGYTRNAIVHEGRLDPGVALISKPFTYDELATKVRALLDG